MVYHLVIPSHYRHLIPNHLWSPKYTSGPSSLEQILVSSSPENIEISQEVESQYNYVSSSQTEPVDSSISEEITVINPQLQLSRILTRAHRNEIGQPPIKITIPERGI